MVVCYWGYFLIFLKQFQMVSAFRYNFKPNQVKISFQNFLAFFWFCVHTHQRFPTCQKVLECNSFVIPSTKTLKKFFHRDGYADGSM